MEETYINAMFQSVKEMSEVFGRAWLLSNGTNLDVVTTWEDKETRTSEENGYWVAAIFEDGHPVEA